MKVFDTVAGITTSSSFLTPEMSRISGPIVAERRRTVVDEVVLDGVADRRARETPRLLKK